MAENELVVEVREATGKGAARRLRQAGRIPGVCYGRNATPVSVSLDPKGLEHVLTTSSSGLNTLFELKGGGDFDGKPVLVRELLDSGVTKVLKGRFTHSAFKPQLKIHN